jgi:hypothetical protein
MQRKSPLCIQNDKTFEQPEALEALFKKDNKPSTETRRMLAEEIGNPPESGSSRAQCSKTPLRRCVVVWRPDYRSIGKAKVGSLKIDLARKVRDRNNAQCWNLRGHQLPRRNIEPVEKLTQEQIGFQECRQFLFTVFSRSRCSCLLALS